MDRGIRIILLVDGNASSLFYLGMLLKRLEYKVETARNGEDALRKMDERPPSIVLSDISLPDMSGVDVLKHMKETPLLRPIPVVMLTSAVDPGMRDTCMRLGCAAYLFKPIEPEMLYRTLQSVSESIPRAHIRLTTLLKVIIGDGTVVGGMSRTEYAIAISEGGMYVRTFYPQPQGALTPVRIFFTDQEIRAKAIVLYSYATETGPYKQAGMGMKFVEMSDSDRAAIRSFIKDELTRNIATL